MHSGRPPARGSLVDYARAGVILLGAVLMGLVALVVGPTQVRWPATQLVLLLLIGLSALLTVRFMPIRLSDEPRSRDAVAVSDGARNPRTAIVAIATVAGGAAAPLLAEVGAFFLLLAILSGWLCGLSAKVILRSRGPATG